MAQKPTDKAETPKRDLGVDLESAHRLWAFLAPFQALPDVILGAIDAEQRVVAAAKALEGLNAQKAVLEGEIASLTTKAEEARTESDKLIREANQRTAVAQQRALKAEQESGERLAKLATDARVQEKALEDAHAAAVHEREQAIARLDGRVTTLKAELDALLKRLGG